MTWRVRTGRGTLPEWQPLWRSCSLGLHPTLPTSDARTAQQLAVVKTMAADLSFPVDVRGLPIVRERDGLALSSRNVRIAAKDRISALGLSRALLAAGDRFEAGERSARAFDQGRLGDTRHGNIRGR